MPLIKSKSKKAREKNIETEIKAGKDPKQAMAIAYDMQRRSKYAKGGEVDMKINKIDGPKMVEGSIADRIRKRKMMAEGGQVDIMDNNAETPNQYYGLNEDEALDYNPNDDMKGLHQPEDSNEIGDESEEKILDRSVVSAIRRKIKSKL